MNPTPELSLIIPVYNEEDIIQEVIHDWVKELRQLAISFEIRCYNDGSKDASLAKMQELTEQYPELKVIDKTNSGHGPTILKGYRETPSPFLFQIDSDNEMKSSSFPTLWEKREQYDFLVGSRDFQFTVSKSRQFISRIASMVIRLFYGKGVKDVNSPYRLMRREAFEDLFGRIPEDTFAPNLIIAGFAARKKLRIYTVPVPAFFRMTGMVSIRQLKLLKVAIKAFWQTILFSFRRV